MPELIQSLLMHAFNSQDDNSSYDFVKYDNDPSPNFNDSHGTECAGVVSMSKSNGLCGVGVAYNAKIAGMIQFTALEPKNAVRHEASCISIIHFSS